MFAAMILAAGRGERMRPLTDTTPKPLLLAGGKPLIVWQIEALARAGFCDIVVNASHLASHFVAALGDGARFGVSLKWSIEPEALETAGGIATALPLLPLGPVLIVSGDIWTAYDYTQLRDRAVRMAAEPASPPRVHLVMVDNPPYHPRGDFALDGDRIALDGDRSALDDRSAPDRDRSTLDDRSAPDRDRSALDDDRSALDGDRSALDDDRSALDRDRSTLSLSALLTFGNIGLYDTALFQKLPRGVKQRLLPLYHDWIARGWVSGEHFTGTWANVGTPADLAVLNTSIANGQRQARSKA